MQPTRRYAQSPLARTAVLLLLAASVLAAVLVALLSRPTAGEGADLHLNQPRLEALRWLRNSLQPGSAPRAECAQPPAVCATLEQLNQRLAQASQAHALQPAAASDSDEAQAPPADTALADAADWLLRAAPDGDQLLDRLRAADNPAPWWRFNPFRLPGCLYAAASAGAPAPAATRCDEGTPLAPGDYPAQANALFALLGDWRAPWQAASPNTLANGLHVGRHLWLTLDPGVQQKAQITAACYSGQAAACARCGWCVARHAREMYENARARSVGILVVKASDGAILGLGSASSACYVERQQGRPAGADCPALPDDKARLHRLDNQVEEAEMPGSLNKPQLAAALLAAQTLHAQERRALPDILRSSDTEAMIDLVLCRAADFDLACIRRRLAALERVLASTGWNAGCRAGEACRPQLDLLGGLAPRAGEAPLLRAAYRENALHVRSAALAYPVFAGRLLRTADGRSLAERVDQLRPEDLRDCARQAGKQRWRGCQGADLVNLLAELFGQGNALATPLGIAESWLHLAAAANGAAQAAAPHLLAAVQESSGERRPVAPLTPTGLAQHDARSILGALEGVHRSASGTAFTACRNAVSAGGVLRCAATGGPRIAGKTGTPLFPADRLTLDEWRQQCAAARQAPDNAQTRRVAAACRLRPIKWFAALAAPTAQAPFDTLLVVKVERNWRRSSQRVDAAGDRGPDGNVAAEIGLALLNSLYTPATAVAKGSSQ
ncbi:MAG TPA: hypothetical protein PKE44_14845 [Plasticicumulans sp.]|uniref:hypothetical protein n=1 Tax=Plasticicumulans sp. TaxID=2307179 RepID=UPI002CDCAE9D|nr:hypothetical protein [Plasticicumulans sp.]HMW30835.1 hypothetical protein [Plasticicumulans sp.]